MSLCNTNWKELLTGETHPKPDVEFEVVDVDGRRTFPAHMYLLTVISPVFKEQFYGKSMGKDVKEGRGGTVVRVALDTSFRAAEAFFKYIYQKWFGCLSFNDLFELLKLSERYQLGKLTVEVKEAIAKFIVDNMDEVVEEIRKMKVEKMVLEDKDFGKFESITNKLYKSEEEKQALTVEVEELKKQLTIAQDKNAQLQKIGRYFRTKFTTTKEELDEVLARKAFLEQEKENCKHDKEIMQKDNQGLKEVNEKLMKENDALVFQKTDVIREKEEMNKYCEKLVKEIAEMMGENADMKTVIRDLEKRKDSIAKPDGELITCKALQDIMENVNNNKNNNIAINTELPDVKKETNLERSEITNLCSYSSGDRTLLSVSTSGDNKKIKECASKLEMEEKTLKAKVLTIEENRQMFRKALSNANDKLKNITVEKKQLEEEMESMKLAFGAQINFLKKENDFLKQEKERIVLDQNSFNPKHNPVQSKEVEISIDREDVECSVKSLKKVDFLSFDLSDKDIIEDEKSDDLRMSLDQRKARKVVMNVNIAGITDANVDDNSVLEKYTGDESPQSQVDIAFDKDANKFVNELQEISRTRKRSRRDSEERTINCREVRAKCDYKKYEAVDYGVKLEEGEYVESELVKHEVEDVDMIQVTVPNRQDDALSSNNTVLVNENKKCRRSKKSYKVGKKIRPTQKETKQVEKNIVFNKNTEKKSETKLENIVIRNNGYGSKTNETR